MKTLANKKVYVAGKSAEIQKKAFEMGFWWGNGYTVISSKDSPFLFFNSDKCISTTHSMSFFTTHDYEEITAEEILAMEVEKPEEKFYPFQKVLVMDKKVKRWVPDFYSEKADYGHITVGGQHWDECIDYKSNRHLIFTTDKP